VTTATHTTSSPYTLAIDSTRDTIVARANQYKRLVIVVSLGTMAAVIASTALGHPAPLLALTLLVPIVIGHFAIDLHLVHRWRTTALGLWADGTLQIDLFSQTLRQVPSLPRPTVEGMLDCLPAWRGAEVPAPARPALVTAQQALGRHAVQALWCRAAGWALVSAATLAAWGTGRPAWLAMGVAPPLFALAWRLGRRHRLRQVRASVAKALAAAEVDLNRGRAWLDAFSWHGLPRADAEAWYGKMAVAAAGR
jgi:hypothetical protein